MTRRPAVPPMERYRDALRIMAYTMPPSHRQLLLKHYRADGHTMTATELAEAVGYENHEAVNLQYGTLGEKLAARMNWQIPKDIVASYAMASFLEPDDDHPHWRWVMRSELAKALEALGWVKPNPATTDATAARS